jgi:hypothetical protein
MNDENRFFLNTHLYQLDSTIEEARLPPFHLVTAIVLASSIDPESNVPLIKPLACNVF